MSMQQSREELFKELENVNWDVVIVGGGITGAGILRESARRGLKAILIEQQDFAWGTSSRSTKMVHGGMRYLKQGNLSLTRESVVERENLIEELPGLVESHSFVLPYFKGNLFQSFTVKIGLILYNLLSGKWRKIKASIKEMAKLAPLIDSDTLKGGFLIHDAVTDDARLVLRVLQEAEKHGGKAINYCKALKLLKEQDIACGVKVINSVTDEEYTIHAKLVINATGAWADNLRTQVKQENKKHIRPLRGSHIILSAKRLPLVDNISLIHPEDGRPVTTLAWEGRILMGTTDIDHRNGLDSEAIISKEEIQYLLKALNYQFPKAKLTDDDIISTMAGIRPVIDTGKTKPSEESRDHVIWLEDGLLTVTGGKLTTFRVIALDALKKAQEVLGKLPDLNRKQKIFSDKININTKKHQGLPAETIKRLYGRYGNSVKEKIIAATHDELQPIPELHTLWIELLWAAKSEMVVHLDDLMLRRTRIGILLENGGKAFLSKIRKICQSALAWNDQKWEEEESRYLKIWQKYYSIPTF